MTIIFPPVEAWDGNRDVAAFPADVNGKRVHCAVSWEALQDNFGGNNISSLDCFRANRSAIEAKAERLILLGRFEQDGSILIRSQDGP
jgi:hypothetical protein